MATHGHRMTCISRALIKLTVLWGLIGLPALGNCADDGDFARATLRGLQGVFVLIEDLSPESERAGLTAQQRQTDVEEQLRHAGMPVLTQEQAFRVQGAPYLYVYCNLTDKSAIDSPFAIEKPPKLNFREAL